MAALCFVAAFFIMSVFNWIELIPWRKSMTEHWTERARILWPARRTHLILILYVPLLLVAGSASVVENDIFHLVICWLAAAVGAVGAGWFVTRQLYPGIHWRPWLHDLVTGWALRLGIWFVLLGIGFSMPDEFNLRTWLTLAGVIVLHVTWQFMIMGVLRRCGIIRPPSGRLRRIIDECNKSGTPRVRGLWQASGVVANALALPLTGELVFYDRLLDITTDEELAAVCSHELEHLAESKWVLIGRYFGAMSFLPLLLLKPASHRWEAVGFLAMLLLMVFWARLSRRLVYRMETRADAMASHQQISEGVYAKALEKIYQNNQMPAVMPGNQTTHPNLYDRMLAAGTTPEFSRPLEPKKYTPLGWVAMFAGPILLMWIFSDTF